MRARVLITGSPIEVVRPIQKLLKADHAMGVRVIQEGGTYTEEMETPLPVGEGKAELVRNIAQKFEIDLTKSKAYGNSCRTYLC